MLKTTTGFVVTAVLLVAFESRALPQGGARTSERQAAEIASQAEELFHNALILSDAGESESARLELQKAIHLWVQMREPGKAARAALQIGDRSKQARSYQDSLYYYRQALNIKSLPGAVKANALNAIALIYADLYVHDLAEHYFNQALGQARIVNDLFGQTMALTGLADVYRRQGALEKAQESVTKALRLSKKDDAGGDPALLYLKGLLSQEQGRLESAKGAFAEALSIYRKTGNVAGQVRVLCGLSTLFLLVSQKQAALEHAQLAAELAEGEAKRIVTMADEVNARELRWRATLSRARAERALGQGEIAFKSYDWAMGNFAAMFWQFHIATETSAVAFREDAQAGYREFVDLTVELGQFEKAYELADEAKARVTLNLTTVRRARPPSGDSKQAATQREQSANIARLRLQLLAAGLSRERQAKLQKDIEEAEYKMQELRLDSEMTHSRERLVWSSLAKADTLRKQMARDQMALVEFALGENRSFGWLFTRGEVYFEILPPRKQIEKEVKHYLDVLAATPNHFYIERDLAKLRGHSKALFATLFGALSSRLEPGQRLIVVPDGLLHYLPFEALIHNQRYLVEDHEISYSPSASLLVQPQDSRDKADTGDRMELLAFGDPIFGPSARAFRGFKLPRLPRTRDEVQQIARLFPPDRTRLYLGKASSEGAVKRESLRRYRRLHFATHSLIDETSPSRSAVVLTLDPDEDGFLEVSEISELDLDCDLVVLSACQTGRGQLLSGEGILGLTRAFLHAGARAVVVSHWNVSDISTARLMEHFYRQLTTGYSNAAALRATKLQMLNSDKETRHPYYWASFVMVGRP